MGASIWAPGSTVSLDSAALAVLGTSGGSNLIGFLQAGTGAVLRTMQAKERDIVSVADFDADGSGDDTTKIQAALDSGAMRIYAPAPAYTISATLVIPPYVEFYGTGKYATTITIAADVVGLRLKTYSRLRGIRITKTGAHTSNGVDVGSDTISGARARIIDVMVDGVGADGISVRDGNAGTLRDVECINNGRDGIHFGIETANNNAWKFEGSIDVRANTRDGVHLETAATVGHANAPRSHSCDFLVTQQNGRHGLYIGTRSNRFVVYSEANTTSDIYIDVNGAGNLLEVLEALNLTDNSAASLISWHNAAANYNRVYRGPVLFEGGAGNGWQLNNDDGTAGTLTAQKTAARQYNFNEASSAAHALTSFGHFNAAFRHDFKAGSFSTSTSVVAVPSGVATTVATFGVTSDDSFCGLISVRDAAGTRIGSSAIITNFVDGGAQTLFASSVQNSGVSASALTISGANVQFAHTVGSSRNVIVTLTRFGGGKSV